MAENQATFVVKVLSTGLKATESALNSLKNVGMKAARGITSAFSSVFKAIFSLKSAILGLVGVGGFAALFVSISNTIDRVGKLSQELGISTKLLGGYGLTADLAGTSLEEVTSAMGLMTKTTQEFIKNGGGPAADAIKSLGITSTQLKPILNDTNAQFALYAQKLSELPDGAVKSSLAMELFGRAGKSLIPLLNEGAEGLAKMQAKAEEMGIALSSSTVKGVERANDAFTLFVARIKGVALNIVGSLAPSIEKMFDFLSKKLKTLVDSKGGPAGFGQFLITEFLNFGKILIDGFQALINGFSKSINALLIALSKFPGSGINILDAEGMKKSNLEIQIQQMYLGDYISQLEDLKKVQEKNPDTGILASLGFPSENIKLIRSTEVAIEKTKKRIEGLKGGIELLNDIDLSTLTNTLDNVIRDVNTSLPTYGKNRDDGIMLSGVEDYNKKRALDQQQFNEKRIQSDKDYIEVLKTLDPTIVLGEQFARQTLMVDNAHTSEIISIERANEIKIELQKNYFDELARLQNDHFMYSINTSESLVRANKQSTESLANDTLGFFANIAAQSANQSKNAFKVNQAFSIANAVISGHEAAVKAYAFGAKFGGPAGGAAMAALAIAATGYQINQIRKAQFGGGASAGGGSVGSVGGGSSLNTIPPNTITPQVGATDKKQQPNISVTIYGDVTGQDVVDKITTALKEKFASDDIFFESNSAQAQITRAA